MLGWDDLKGEEVTAIGYAAQLRERFVKLLTPGFGHI
jgi:hypothetical protein